MSKKTLVLALVAAIFAVFWSSIAYSANYVFTPPELPPSSPGYSGKVGDNFFADPNIIASLIGVLGLLIGSAITIIATFVMYRIENKREDNREDTMNERHKKEKEHMIKQEMYKQFLNDLSHLETFSQKSADNFKREWAKLEVKVDLVASPRVRETKEKLQHALLKLAERNIKSGETTLDKDYIAARDKLLDAIRQDIDIMQQSKK
ncbi:hypothetical protein ACFL2V_15220 [Pseudomonadota bacterium]